MYQKIKELCRNRGISVSALEKSLGFSNGSIAKWATSLPRVDSAIKVANFFGVPVTQLLELQDEEKEQGEIDDDKADKRFCPASETGYGQH